ncbi:MAG: argininosuccinate lyase [Phycisphaerales bacterium]
MSRGLAQGRFDKEADPLFREINDSLAFDARLARQDIAGSIAWARAIRRAGVISGDELPRLVAALEELAALVSVNPDAPLGSGHEDIHSWVEAELVKRVGALGKRLHTGRSRNDQVATDLRLWCREAIDARLTEIHEAQRSLARLARRELATAMPGYTHLQRGQPILLSHWALAYVEMLARDAERFADARRRANRCPLGSGALAGTAYSIDREALASDLGFDGPTANSLDAVGDRDFVLETISVAATTAIHLSRLAEELILWCTSEFGFVVLDDSVTSGSSLMPQKKNPDALELIRGKCGRVLGAHTALATMLKGLPLAYNKDMQEDKEPLFDAMASLSLCLRIVPRVADGTRVDRDRCRDAALGGHTNATELADYLVSKGVAFRDAHDATGRLVRRAIELGLRLEHMPIEELRTIAPAIGEDVRGWLTIESALSRREITGGTGPNAVVAALDAWESRLA